VRRWDCRHWQCWPWIATVAAIVASATVLHAALPTEPDVSGRTSLAGELLIAAPALRDPHFARAVILMAQHSRDGALGVIINRPLDTRSIASLLQAFGADPSGVADSVQVFLGGPVSPEAGLVIHTADYRRPDTVDIDGRVALTAAPDVLHDIGLGRGPRKSLVAFGYAGWAPSQLEDEIAQGAWYSVPEDLALVFDDDRSALWDEAMARHRAFH
jgi:putative transcriptional regulator